MPKSDPAICSAPNCRRKGRVVQIDIRGEEPVEVTLCDKHEAPVLEIVEWGRAVERKKNRGVSRQRLKDLHWD